ncbi:MAG: hypothetical protein LBO06_06820 [Bacteroidales bacterium]|nr:hypothetical protein [Bacteroidales bacterium]
MFGWLIFAIEDIEKLKVYLSHMFNFSSWSGGELKPIFAPMVFVAIFFSFFPYLKTGQKVQNYFYDKQTYKTYEHILLFVLFVLLMIIRISHIIASDFNPFIYFRF